MENSQSVTNSDLYLSAVSWIENGDYDRAMRMLKSIDNYESVDEDTVLNCIGAIHMKNRNYDKATDYFFSAISLNPIEQYYCNVAQSLMMQGSPLPALRLCEEWGLSGKSQQIHLRAHAAAHMLKDFDKADELLELAGDSAEAVVMRGMRAMARREWAEGVDLYGARKVMYDPYVTKLAKEKFVTWKDVLSCGYINVVLEQGLGDCIMMIPYILRLSEHYSIPTCVISLDGRHDYFVDDIMSSYDSIKTKKVSSELLSNQLGKLIWMFDLLGMQDKPLEANGYINVNKQIKDLAWWSKGMIGICWRGNPAHNNDLFRSMQVEKLGRILDLPKVLSIQTDLTESEKYVLLDHGINHWDQKGLISLAAVVSNLNCVVTVDTAMSHLAGALGVKCYTMLPTNADWRWGDFDLVERSDIYTDTHTLVRQSKCKDWSSVIDYVFNSINE